MFKNLLILSFIFLFSIVTFAQNKSVYTDLAAEKCKTASVNQGMPGNYVGKCAGAGGYNLEVYLDDERNSIGVVLPNNETIGLDFWNHFGNFSELGAKAEWRMKGKTPVALIVRLNVSDQGDDGKTTLIFDSFQNYQNFGLCNEHCQTQQKPKPAGSAVS